MCNLRNGSGWANLRGILLHQSNNGCKASRAKKETLGSYIDVVNLIAQKDRGIGTL
jgi:hypothetical protein